MTYGFFFILGFPLASQHKMSENKVECQAKSKINFEPTDSDSEMAQKSDEDSNPFTTDNEVEDELETDDNVEEEISSSPPDLKEKVADGIIHFFRVKSPTRFIDTDSDEDLISYEESELRLIILGLSLSSILSLTSLILLIHYAQLISPNESFDKEKKMLLIGPKIAIIDAQGTGFLVMYNVTQNESLIQDWILKLPKHKSESKSDYHKMTQFFHNTPIKARKYYGFTDQKKVYIPYGDEFRNMVVIDPNKTHRLVPKSKLTHGCVWDTMSVKIGQYFWIVGGQDLQNPEMGWKYGHIQRTVLWSIKKSRWLAGPQLPQPINEGCGLALTRTHAQLLVSPVDGLYVNHCIQSWIFNFDTWFWTVDNECFYQLPQADEWLMLSCNQVWGKVLPQRNIYLWISIYLLPNRLLLFSKNGSVIKLEPQTKSSKVLVTVSSASSL